ncbi:MAG: COX15/CtaA family protein [Candidatus Eremiobacteraeota bacterium]|nr:COX15/CtaA family protein [Candidatus Eremiobacteraeota bacterium]
MKILWRLALAAAIVAYGVAVLGSWVRINGAGMTCPDWPLCHGALIPSLANGTLWEWSHRLLVLVETPLVAAVIFTGWPLRNRLRAIAPMMGVIGGLFVVQVLLGAVTVHLSNSPMSVVLHWGTAMAFLSALVAMSIFVRTAAAGHAVAVPAAGSGALLGILAGTAFIAFLTMCVGAYVSSSGAGLACAGIPGCAGNVVVYTSGQFVQMLHRFVAGTCLLSGAAAFAVAWRFGSPRVRIMASAGLFFLFGQIVLGLLNVALRLPVALREAHAANAALTFLIFVVAATFAALDSLQFRAPAQAR